MTTLVEKIVLCHEALQKANLPHAFGGALALAWCTQSARGTIDIDINLFVEVDQASAVFAALPAGVEHTKKDLQTLVRDTQHRLFWEATPIDLFLNSTPYHNEVQTRIRWEHFANKQIPFLSCQDLAVFKAFFNRTKDWADLEEMYAAGTLNWRAVAGVLTEYLGGDDERIAKLRALAMRSID
jgi:hypothetical protein